MNVSGVILFVHLFKFKFIKQTVVILIPLRSVASNQGLHRLQMSAKCLWTERGDRFVLFYVFKVCKKKLINPAL